MYTTAPKAASDASVKMCRLRSTGWRCIFRKQRYIMRSLACFTSCANSLILQILYQVIFRPIRLRDDICLAGESSCESRVVTESREGRRFLKTLWGRCAAWLPRVTRRFWRKMCRSGCYTTNQVSARRVVRLGLNWAMEIPILRMIPWLRPHAIITTTL